jgi:endonuclease G
MGDAGWRKDEVRKWAKKYGDVHIVCGPVLLNREHETIGKNKRDQFINTVDEVERITGYDFFPALPDSIEDVVEGEADISEW